MRSGIDKDTSLQFGTSTEEALLAYQSDVGVRIKRPDANRAYLPMNLWSAPIWLPPNRARKASAYPIVWADRFGNRYTVCAAHDLAAAPDMDVLIGLAAVWQYAMINTEVTLREIDGDTFVHIELPMPQIYRATGYSSRDKRNLLNSLARLSSIYAEVEFSDGGDGKRPGKIIFSDFFRYGYIPPVKHGAHGTLAADVNRIFIPRKNSLWHPAQMCQSLNLPTSKLIYWAMAPCLRGWLGSVYQLYELINRRNRIEQLDAKKYRNRVMRWKTDRLVPAAKELRDTGFKIDVVKGICGPDEIIIKWPEARKALNTNTREGRNTARR